jgi:hypothetical protein
MNALFAMHYGGGHLGDHPIFSVMFIIVAALVISRDAEIILQVKLPLIGEAALVISS